MDVKRLLAVAAAALAATMPAGADDVYDFFKARLSGEPAVYSAGKKKLSQKEVQQQRVQVWKTWRKAVRKVDADSLARMNKDSLTATGKWRLPPDLENDATMNYTLFSKGARPSAGYPLIVYLHGSGPKEQEYATGLKLTREFRDAPSVYFVPQIPNEGGYYRWWQKAKVWAWQKLLRQALAQGDVDPDRIYLTGISEGAYGTQRLTAFFADYLAAGAALAGGEPLKNAPAENCANTPFALFTGDHDAGFYRSKLTQYTRDAFDSLAAGSAALGDSLYRHNVQLIAGRGHSIDYSVATPWLVKFTRNPYPKYVAWEDFEMDGCRRNGFYNLLVEASPAKTPQERVMYEERIKGDTILLNVSSVEYAVTEKDSVWGIELKFRRSYTPVSEGKVTVFLNRSLVDLNRRITLVANGKTVFSGKVVENEASIVNSCAAFGDPRRLFTAQINVDLSL
jgi:predicted esterase